MGQRSSFTVHQRAVYELRTSGGLGLIWSDSGLWKDNVKGQVSNNKRVTIIIFEFQT